MSTPVKRKITLDLNPNKKVLPKDRPSVFQRLGTKKFPLTASASSTGGSGLSKQREDQEPQEINKEEIVKRIVGCDEPKPVPPPKIVPESVSVHARLIEAQLAAKLGKVIVSRGETIGANNPIPPTGPSSKKNAETDRGTAGHSTSTAGERGGGGSNREANSSVPSASAGGGWDQSTLENADQDILERKRKELQHELKLEMDASGGGSSSHHHHHHRHTSSATAAMKAKSAKETLVVKKVRKVPPPRRSSSSSDSSSSSGSDSSDSDSSSSSSSSSRDSRRVKKRAIRHRRDSSSSSERGGNKKIVKKHAKKIGVDGTKRIVTKKVGTHLTTKIRVKKVTSPGGTSHLRKVAREVSPSGKTPVKYAMKKVVALKKDKHSVTMIDARERVREKEREVAIREKEREREKERLRLRERERDRAEHVKSRSPPRSHIRSRSPRSRVSPAAMSSSSRGGRELSKKSPEPSRYRDQPVAVARRPERSPERIDDRRRHESLKERERRERQEREVARNKEREEALARCQERQRERERLAAVKEKSRRPMISTVMDKSVDDGGLEKPDRHRPVERLLPRPAERARALAAARSPGKLDHDRSRTPNSPRSRDRIAPRERSYDRGGVERGYMDHHERRSRSREPREYVTPIVRGARSRDSPFERHAPPMRETRDYRDSEQRGYEKERRGLDYTRTEYPDDPLPRREHEREWERERDREPDRGNRGFDRRGTEDHSREWDRDPIQASSHGHSHSQEPYQTTSRSWDDPHWKKNDGWNSGEKERGDWKYQQDRQWDRDDHSATGPPSHSHAHGGGGRWQSGHPDQNQGTNWHGKAKEDMEFTPRHKLAGRLGDGGGERGGTNDRGMFRRHHPGHQPMFLHGRKSHVGMGQGRFGNQAKYSITRTPQNIGMQHQQPHQSSSGSGNTHQQCGMPDDRETSKSVTKDTGRHESGFGNRPTEKVSSLADSVAPVAAVAEWDEEADAVPIPISAAPVPAAAVAVTTEAINVTAAQGESVAESVPAVEKVQESAAEPILDEDNLSEISDDPDDILTREEDVSSQLHESSSGDKLSSTEQDPSSGGGTHLGNTNSEEAQLSIPQPAGVHQTETQASSVAVNQQELKDAKEAGKLHANKELKEEMDLDFEEISDGELEEENKVKGLGDALGVDWASLAHETRAKLKPEQTIPVSARNRWKSHHILLDIGISVRLAGEAYAQRVLTGSKEKLREEIEEFKAAAAAAEQQKVAAVKKEQEEQLFNGIKIKKEVLDEDEQEAQKELERKQATKMKSENEPAESRETSEQEANLAGIDKILHPVASVHVAMRERARARRDLILCSSGPHSRALSARRDLEIRRQLCGFPPQECNERISEHQSLPTNPELHETVLKLFQATMQPNKIEVQ
ncbi:fl(2)d-associated complex component isoform X2 [Wyeomyia smithii]|uniref:fl(2)d-associated complex component isoform X2 n=1 Tax=Wyeomyia smithii TaxID=174621 RepID=UPI002467FCCE|nr:fl(2)d-associated complex component isoform X2 [Wyeomyia smithii]